MWGGAIGGLLGVLYAKRMRKIEGPPPRPGCGVAAGCIGTIVLLAWIVGASYVLDGESFGYSMSIIGAGSFFIFFLMYLASGAKWQMKKAFGCFLPAAIILLLIGLAMQ